MVRLFKCLLLVLFFMFPTMVVESMFCFKGVLTSDKACVIVFLKSVNSVDTI